MCIKCTEHPIKESGKIWIGTPVLKKASVKATQEEGLTPEVSHLSNHDGPNFSPLSPLGPFLFSCIWSALYGEIFKELVFPFLTVKHISRSLWSLKLGMRLRLTKLSPRTSIFSPCTGEHPSTLVYRIVGKGPVVFMQHGMVGSSTAWYSRNLTFNPFTGHHQAPCWTWPRSSRLPTCWAGLRRLAR